MISVQYRPHSIQWLLEHSLENQNFVIRQDGGYQSPPPLAFSLGWALRDRRVPETHDYAYHSVPANASRHDNLNCAFASVSLHLISSFIFQFPVFYHSVFLTQEGS